jgi:hypothetical protein
MDRRRERIKARYEGGAGRIQIFIIDAEDAVVPGRVRLCPATRGNDLLQRHPVSGAAPCRNDHVRILLPHRLLIRMMARRSHEDSPAGLNQFGHPRL